jgi:protein-S-isoprenylcysteine O-methyltransferase Ste14
MSGDGALRVLAIVAIVPAGATPYFIVFWSWFDFWRRHRVLTYTLMLGTLGGLAVAATALRDALLAPVIDLPGPARALGWALIVIANVLGMVADRQLGLRVRSFTPFFEAKGRIQLKTTGAYGVVRHPIYAAGIYFQLGVFLVTGCWAVAAACGVFTLGALWFTRQEERRLITLLDDPGEYDRYRARVPALFPFGLRSRDARPPHMDG